jgi:uncharacterized membrane protein YccC
MLDWPLAMRATDPPPTVVHPRRWAGAVGWVGNRDHDLLATKRSVRAAIVIPGVFAATHLLFSNPQVGLFGAFGSFALLLLVDFQGRPRTRLLCYGGLFGAGTVLIALATLVSSHKIAAVVTMGVVGFLVLFVGIVSPQAAAASTAALLTFVLPVAVVQPAAAIGPRLVGWLWAGALSIPAALLIWPPPWHDNLRRRLSAALTAIGHLAQAYADGGNGAEAKGGLEAEMARLRQQFAGTPYPATSAAVGAVALTKLEGRVEWLADNDALTAAPPSTLEASMVKDVMGAVAETLQLSASLVCDDRAHPVDDPALVRSVEDATHRLDRLLITELDARLSTLVERADDSGADPTPPAHRPVAPARGAGADLAVTLDPTFHARGLGIATILVANAVLRAAGATPHGGSSLDDADERSAPALLSRLRSHLSFRSVWFRNAARGGIGLAVAVAVVEITDVEHGFWVVLGTLSVLRSNALGTGSTALRAIGGTTVGFVIGSLLLLGVGTHEALLWVLLPVAVLISGVAPSMISFAAGQAGFTVVVVILFNIIHPTGWKVGLTRVEDVAIGCAVSLVVGLLFWPRGATAALARALSDSFVDNSGYLVDAVERLTTTSGAVDTGPGQRMSHSAFLRLDDAFRQFLAERGAKVVPVTTVTRLFTGSNRLRLAGYTLSRLPTAALAPGTGDLESVMVAGAVLRDAYSASHRWYEEFAQMLSDRRSTLDPPPVHDDTLTTVLGQAVDEARATGRVDRLRATLQMLWADELLQTQRPVQEDLATSAALFAHHHHRRRLPV